MEKPQKRVSEMSQDELDEIKKKVDESREKFGIPGPADDKDRSPEMFEETGPIEVPEELRKAPENDHEKKGKPVTPVQDMVDELSRLDHKSETSREKKGKLVTPMKDLVEELEHSSK